MNKMDAWTISERVGHTIDTWITKPCLPTDQIKNNNLWNFYDQNCCWLYTGVFFFNFLIVSGGGKKKNIYYTYKFNRKLFDVCINYVTPSSIYDFCLLFFLSNLAISFKSSSLGS